MSTRLPVRDAVSAGGVVWRSASAGNIEVVVCGRASPPLWVLPKGTPDDGESMEETAKREAEEETGLKVRLGDQVGTIEYWFVSDGFRWHKRVHHWLMEPVGGSVDDHDHEFDEVRWVGADDALMMLTYENERRVLREAVALLGQGQNGA